MVSLTSKHNIDSVTQRKQKKNVYIMPKPFLVLVSHQTRHYMKRQTPNIAVCCIKFMNQFCTHKCLYTELNCRSSMPLWRRPKTAKRRWHTDVEVRQDEAMLVLMNANVSKNACIEPANSPRTLGAKH